MLYFFKNHNFIGITIVGFLSGNETAYLMKTLKLFLVFVALSAVLAGCKEKEVLSPDLKVGQKSISISSEGGVMSVDYELVNPVSDGKVSADAGVEWVTDYDCVTDGKISFTVAPNTGAEERKAVLVIRYEYGEDVIEKNVELRQYAVEVVAADYEFEATVSTADYLGDAFSMNGELNYQLWLSDLPMDNGVQPGGTYYSLDVFAPALKSVPSLAEGEYVLSSSGSMEAMTVNVGDFTYMRKVKPDGSADEVYVALVEGTLSVGYEGENAVLELNAVDAEGKTHHVVFSGVPVYNDYSSTDMGYDALEYDLDFEVAQLSAVYKSDENGTMNVMIQFTDMQSDDSGFLITPGSILEMSLYMPYSEDGFLTEGTYKASGGGEKETFYPGGMTPFFMFEGTYVTVYGEDNSTVYGMCTDGSVTISGSNGNYSIEVDLVTENGFHVRTSYSGALQIKMPGPISTLTGDYTLDLSSAKGLAYYCGDYYKTGGGNWIVNLQPSDGVTGDGLSADIVCTGLDFKSGIVSGTYKASESDAVLPGYYLKGYMDQGSLYGTIYMGNISDGGFAQSYAPAVDGEFNIVNNGDGTYRIQFSFVDDKGFVWDGEWEGEIELIENTQSSRSMQRTSAVFSQPLKLAD